MLTACDNLNPDERGLVRATFLDTDGSPSAGMYVELSSRLRNTVIENSDVQSLTVPESASILGNGITNDSGTVEFVTLLDGFMKIYGLKDGKSVVSVQINNLVSQENDYSIIIPEIQLKSPAELTLNFSNQSGRTDDFFINVNTIPRENCSQIWDGNDLTDNLNCFEGFYSFEILGGQEIPDVVIQTVFPASYSYSFFDFNGNPVGNEVVVTSQNMSDEIVF
jgi:hypothetical protein